MGMVVNLADDYDTAVTRITAALKAEGFGVLTEIDVKATMKQKLDVDFRRYVILGACNPPIAHRALSAAPEVGLMMPCNVTVAENDDGTTTASFLNPLLMAQMVDNDALPDIAQEAYERISRVVTALQG